MNETEINFYRQRLLALKKRLVRDESQLMDEALAGVGGEASGGLSDVPLHQADLGSHQFEEDLTLDLLGNEDQIVEEVNAAWARLEQGTFGRCEECQKTISKERLQALPYARYCVECADRLQNGAKK
jgi:RNA polymerase-binding transcription factor DksA